MTTLSGVTVAGVTRTYLYSAATPQTPPLVLSPADLPAMWFQLPQGGMDPIVFAGGASWPMLRAEVVIAVMPFRLSLAARSFLSCVTLMDALNTGLQAIQPAKSKMTWTMRQAVVEVGGAEFWAVVCLVGGGG